MLPSPQTNCSKQQFLWVESRWISKSDTFLTACLLRLPVITLTWSSRVWSTMVISMTTDCYFPENEKKLYVLGTQKGYWYQIVVMLVKS